MTLIEVLTSSVMASIVLLASTQTCFHVHHAITKQNNLSILQSEGIQAFHMMGQAIQHAQTKTNPPKSSLLKVMAKDSSVPSNKKSGEFQVRKGAASVNSSDAFYTYDAHGKREGSSYKAFFIQQQGHYQNKDGVLYLQTQNKKGALQNDAVMAHVQSMQIKVGVPNASKSILEWLEPYQINDSGRRHPQWKHVRALKIQLTLQRGKTPLELERVFALRH